MLNYWVDTHSGCTVHYDGQSSSHQRGNTPSHSHLNISIVIVVVTYCSVVPMHAEMVVRKDIGRSVDIMQGQPHRGHHTLTCRSSSSLSSSTSSWSLTYARLGVSRRCGEEAGNVDVVLVVTMSAKTPKYWQTKDLNIVSTCWGESRDPGRPRRFSCSPRPRCPSWPRRSRRSPGPSPWWPRGQWWPSWDLSSQDTGQGTHCCLVAWRGATSKMFPNYSEFKVKDRLEAHLFDKS